MPNHEDAGFPLAAEGPPATPETSPRLVSSLCGGGSCPTVYATDRDTVLVQGNAVTGFAVPDGELLVEIPRDLLIEAARRIMAQDA
ncbi:hypothetical protein ABZS66_26050 [Dactylosporangium sp. NPDC005572]|uniref:hypothetical protein n=1 Tax=Dactylosporangium sp. NPDC005572 TaxID=3156889 RepID=UPI0033BADFBD